MLILWWLVILVSGGDTTNGGGGGNDGGVREFEIGRTKDGSVTISIDMSRGQHRPMQLIYPDENHQELLINHTVLAALNSLEGEQSVLGVVGTFHSGKSFLLNQLMGTTDTFTVGPTVHPQTLGIWVWSATINVGTDKHNLLLLDTEGFYSSNVSETYDAKIFAITTLLSSHLIYNSVKIIDQSSLEYLELLSRRTQLFALKSQIKYDSPLVKILE
ncbi:guanylate-binding protein [Heterostelium album PN500]|uniref:Guanylate-binding protein n=1 Tax=Heterostelium pallidum (strain ATCC 26659 / Pp 5 / PN500) TaxID=670386 RepID=D3B0L7_HETP5|nr:guanylate-binding protein [Heterostelium album PN500]EFA84841.1 guanylate-binding protein [Heterostelium album PN500]|eukprot:XP_020436952.1 guanylate-binding protein [Heterostelium album PN500]